MTVAELLTLINTTVVANGNNEITADVLRPVLVAMVNQINTLVGNEANLPSGSTTVIDAINNSTSSGITIHEGMDDPNDTPPSSFNLGDFYNQVNGSSITVGFWQYNGIEWAEIITRNEQKQRNIYYTNTNYSVTNNDDIIFYGGSNSNDVVTLPSASVQSNKIKTLVNVSGVNINTSSYSDIDGVTRTNFSSETVLKLVSNGIIWEKINN